MGKRVDLREFQAGLSQKLASAREGRAPDALLGVLSGGERWLLSLPDAGEVLPLPPLSPVPRTQPWFVGVANVRGTLYGVVDFSAFRGGATTPRDAAARLLLIGARHGVNSALLVERALGLRKAAEMSEAAEDAGDAPAWAGERCIDAEGRRWTRLSVKALLEDPLFLDVGR